MEIPQLIRIEVCFCSLVLFGDVWGTFLSEAKYNKLQLKVFKSIFFACMQLQLSEGGLKPLKRIEIERFFCQDTFTSSVVRGVGMSQNLVKKQSQIKMFLNTIFASNLNYKCSNLLDFRSLQEQVEKVFCYQKLFWPFTVWKNCSSDLKIFANSWPSALNFKSFSPSLEQFFLTVGQNNFGSKIPFLIRIVLAD